jgi:hypothetical protein
MHQAEFERHVGTETICDSINDALERAAEVYQRLHSPATHDQSQKEETVGKT